MADYHLKLSDVELMRYTFMAQRALEGERGWWEQAGVKPGAVVADVGCGPAAISVVLAELVGTGRVLGVERDPAALGYAAEMVEQARVGNVTLRAGDATATGLEPGSCDVVMMRHVLAHNGGSEQQIVDHLATLVKPGGAVYLVDVDLTMLRMDPVHPALARMTQQYAAFHGSLGNDPAVGMRLGRLLEAAGLVLEHHGLTSVVTPVPPGFRPPSFAAAETMVEKGAATAADLEEWAAAFTELDAREDRPRIMAPTFFAFGRKA